MKRDVKPGFGGPNSEGSLPAARRARRSPAIPGGDQSGWIAAVRLTELWLVRHDRVDSLLEQLTPDLPPRERARAQHLFYGVVRWASRLEAALEGLVRRPPRSRLQAVLLVAGFELFEGGPEAVARVVHHAVEQAKTVTSPAEARLVNAVARRAADRLAERPAGLAAEWAHPDWLVDRWLKAFGAEATRQLLEWNQTPASVYGRWRSPAPMPDFLSPARWPGFFTVKPGPWDDVRTLAADGSLYLQDPSTRLCVELLGPRPGEDILDACAAPGGKCLLIADALAGGAGRLVAVDEPGPRLARLQANLSLAPSSVQVALVPADLRQVGPAFLQGINLPENFDAVLVDAPCTNTGVMRHRVDVKWRLRPGDFGRHAAHQLVLLRAAARLVRPHGRLVYSTCSLDPAENEEVVARFIGENPGWRLDRQMLARPWIDGHDGGGAFRLLPPSRG